jgi:hypothetical protein
MLIKAHNIAPKIKNRLRTPRLVIIEFILEELLDNGSVGQQLYWSLASNYTKDNRKSICYEQISFNLKNDVVIQGHVAHVSQRVQAIKEK